MMSEEKFFNQVRGHFDGFTPEVPGEVYSGLRRRMWWGGFMKFDATRFNAWYLLILLGGASAGTILVTGSDPVLAKEAGNNGIELTMEIPVAVHECNTPVNHSCSVFTTSAVETSETVIPEAVVEPGDLMVPAVVEIDPEILNTSENSEVTIETIEPTPGQEVQIPAKTIEPEVHGSISDQLKTNSNNLYINTKVYKKK